MADILFLAHRIPYPPDKGDKIRSWNLLSRLAQNHRVHLGCLIDDPADSAHLGRLQAICADVKAIPINPSWRRIASLRGLMTGEALTLPYFRDGGLQRWTDQVLQNVNPTIAFVFSSGMAPYLRATAPTVRRVIDFVDLDSLKWQDYAAQSTGLLGWIYRREGRLLAAAERQFAGQADLSLFVSAQEAGELLNGSPELASRVAALENGVDTVYFDPAIEHPIPDAQLGGHPSLIFTGAMDYRANIEGISWFVQEVLPAIQQSQPQTHLYIVGARPADAVKVLAQRQGVVVTGRVDDIRPWIAHADLAIAPLRIARGIQNKVLEAMAMGKAVLSTKAANTGIEAEDGVAIALADSSQALAEQALRLLRQPDERARLGQAARQHALDRFEWQGKLDAFEAMLLGERQSAYG